MGLRVHKLLLAALLVAGCSGEPSDDAVSGSLKVLTLNLHAYQEISTPGVEEANLTDEMARDRVAAYGPILDRIAAGISELDPDIICLQEVAEWSGEDQVFGAADSNMARQILSRLETPYHATMDWSHYAWGTWREGSAILSRYPIATTASRFISTPDNGMHDNWKSRNVPMARIDVPGIGAVAVYSVHTGWWDDKDEPAMAQYQRLLDWTAETDVPVKILCGDFNSPAGGPGYDFLTSGNHWADQYLLANPTGMFDATIMGGADGWESTDSGQRIDYIFLNAPVPLRVVDAEHVFTATRFGRVSDHAGVYAELTTP